MTRSFRTILKRLLPVADPRRLWIGYITAVSLILALLLGSHLLAMSTVSASRSDAEIVNVSGRQRMLSQRILMLAERHASEPSVENVARLMASIRLFETSHDYLIALDRMSPATREIYFGPPDLDRRSREYIDNARAVLRHAPGPKADIALSALESHGLDALLITLNDATSSFETAARLSSDRIRQVQDLALYFAIAILALVTLLIFRPSQRLVRRALDDLEGRNAQLLAARREAQARNKALARAADELSHNALHDSLTGLGNRAKLHQDLARMLPAAHAAGHRIAVLHIDLDRFKEVNDTLGHAAGDEVLRQVSARMLRRVRKGDSMARVGGDEFVIALEAPSEGAEDAVRWIADDLISAARQPVLHDGVECQVGASVGYVFAEGAGDDPAHLIANADIALYEAKRAGRGRACAFGEEMRADLDRRRLMLQGLERGLDEGRFHAWYQPIAAMDDGRLLRVEALARWRRGDGSISAPGDFIDLAEEVGAIERIDQMVLDGALADIAALRAQGGPAPGLSVNASARTLRDEGFAERLARQARAHGFAPHEITVEVRETTLIEDPSDRAARTIAALSAMGFRTAIDDFGSGYASLANLANLQLTGLKIDRSLVNGLDQPRSQQVVAAIIGLARGLEMDVTAGGVETASQHAALRRLGCDAVQGFALGRPMPAEDLGRWLSERQAPPSARQA